MEQNKPKYPEKIWLVQGCNSFEYVFTRYLDSPAGAAYFCEELNDSRWFKKKLLLEKANGVVALKGNLYFDEATALKAIRAYAENAVLEVTRKLHKMNLYD